MRIYLRPEYQNDIEEVAEALKDSLYDQSDNDEGDFPIKDATYEIKDLEQ